MEIKLFGKRLFEYTKNGGGPYLWSSGEEEAKKTKYLPDFYSGGNNEMRDYAVMEMVATNISTGSPKKTVQKKPVEKEKITAKGVYDLQLLHDKSFKLNTNADYIEKSLTDFKDKLTLISSEEYDMRRGVAEISSIVLRMENRKKYADHKKVFEEFPYTTSTKISALLNNKDHNNLKIGQVAQFLADMPKEATDVMKNYNKACDSLCNKQAVFYIIADKKDFERNNTRRDPILLAQSPFGHFWQILGAWDKEMLFLEEL